MMNVMNDAAAGLPLPADDDRSLAQRVGNGDRAAFEMLMRRHNRRLYRLARSMLRDDAEAEDALQDAYLSAYRSIGQFRGDAALSTWLSRLVLNECLARMRRQARRDNIVRIDNPTSHDQLDTMSASTSDTPDQALVRAEMRALIERKLDELPEAFRTVFVLRCVEEMSVEETAQALGITTGAVKVRLHRARMMLQKRLVPFLKTTAPTRRGFFGRAL